MLPKIFLKISEAVKSFKNRSLSNVSNNPPFLDVIVAHPCAADSIAVLPNGSCHLEGTTEIDALE